MLSRAGRYRELSPPLAMLPEPAPWHHERAPPCPGTRPRARRGPFRTETSLKYSRPPADTLYIVEMQHTPAGWWRRRRRHVSDWQRSYITVLLASNRINLTIATKAALGRAVPMHELTKRDAATVIGWLVRL